MVRVGESMISLLLKLHSQLSGVPDSYNPEQVMDGEAGSSMDTSTILDYESRIGDGPYFISLLLKKIANLDPLCRDDIIETKKRLWPKKPENENEQRDKENREKEERKKRAKERQQKLMAEFASRQKQFMEKSMEPGRLFQNFFLKLFVYIIFS